MVYLPVDHNDPDFAEDAEPEPPRTLEKVIGLTIMAATAVCAIAAFVLRLIY